MLSRDGRREVPPVGPDHVRQVSWHAATPLLGGQELALAGSDRTTLKKHIAMSTVRHIRRAHHHLKGLQGGNHQVVPSIRTVPELVVCRRQRGWVAARGSPAHVRISEAAIMELLDCLAPCATQAGHRVGQARQQGPNHCLGILVGKHKSAALNSVAISRGARAVRGRGKPVAQGCTRITQLRCKPWADDMQVR